MSEELEDDFEEIVPEPQVSPGEQPVLAGLLRCKRRADQFSGNGKRQKVFENDGVEYLVDAELLRDLNGDMELDELDDPEEEPDEDDKARDDERRAHSYKSAAKLNFAMQTRTMTTGMQKVRRTLRKQNITPDDVEYQLNNDIEEFNWVAVPSPWVSLTHKFIGKHADKENCYGCERGLGMDRVDGAAILELRALITDLIPRSEIGHACVQISLWFEKNIKENFNKNLRKGENPIQSWSPNSIFEHIRMHAKESSFLHAEMLEALHEHFRIVRYRSLYRTRTETLRSGRELAIWDIRPSQAGHKMLLETIKAITELESRDPRQMHNHNPKFSVASHYMGGVGSKAVSKKQIGVKSIYDTMSTGL